MPSPSPAHGPSTVPDRPADGGLVRTDLHLPVVRRGKVRDVYRLPGEDGGPPRVLIVATDRISAFDVVMPTAVPDKGRLLTEIAVRWFEFLRPLGIVPDHLLSTDPADAAGLSDPERTLLAGRTMIGRGAAVVPVECVVRGYLSGSGWGDYQRTGAVCGVRLPAGLERSARLDEPIFTPATKADEGHDENIDFEEACRVAGRATMERLRDASMRIYAAARDHAEAHGLILADTKFEFGFALGPDGLPTDELLLVDEVLTPDSSRYWPKADWAPGIEPPSFDKQFVRNWLLGEVEAGRWDKTPPGPALPADVVAGTADRYRATLSMLFGDADRG